MLQSGKNRNFIMGLGAGYLPRFAAEREAAAGRLGREKLATENTESRQI